MHLAPPCPPERSDGRHDGRPAARKLHGVRMLVAPARCDASNPVSMVTHRQGRGAGQHGGGTHVSDDHEDAAWRSCPTHVRPQRLAGEWWLDCRCIWCVMMDRGERTCGEARLGDEQRGNRAHLQHTGQGRRAVACTKRGIRYSLNKYF